MQNECFAERQEPTALSLYVGYREYYNKYDRTHGGNELSASIGSFLLEGVPRCSAWRSRAHISMSDNFEAS